MRPKRKELKNQSDYLTFSFEVNVNTPESAANLSWKVKSTVTGLMQAVVVQPSPNYLTSWAVNTMHLGKIIKFATDFHVLYQKGWSKNKENCDLKFVSNDL